VADAVELLQSDAPFIADTSAWWRFSSLPAELAALVKEAMSDISGSSAISSIVENATMG
jgi:hypothetical protein